METQYIHLYVTTKKNTSKDEHIQREDKHTNEKTLIHTLAQLQYALFAVISINDSDSNTLLFTKLALMPSRSKCKNTSAIQIGKITSVGTGPNRETQLAVSHVTASFPLYCENNAFPVSLL